MAISSIENEETGQIDYYVGSIYPGELVSGEGDIAALQLYPCNNLRLRSISNAALTFLHPNGSPHNGQVTLRAGVYKNNVYCPDALVRTSATDLPGRNGREDIAATVTDGKLNLWFDPTQFKQNSRDRGLSGGDSVTYVIEYRFDSGYRPGYVVLNAKSDMEGQTKSTDSLVQIRALDGELASPQIIRQYLHPYFDGELTNNRISVIDFTEGVGLSKRFAQANLVTDVSYFAGQ